MTYELELYIGETAMLLHQNNDELVALRAALEVERQRYQELLDFAPEAYLVTDPTGLIQEANKAAARLLNIPQQLLVGENLVNFAAASGQQNFIDRIKHICNNIKFFHAWEVAVCPLKSSPIVAAIRVAAFPEPGSNSVYLRVYMREIAAKKIPDIVPENMLNSKTEHLNYAAELDNTKPQLQNEIADRQQVQADLFAALQRLTFHVENSPIAVIEWDSNFRVSRWSRSAERIFGWQAEEVFGLQPNQWQFVYESDIETVTNIIYRLYQGSKEGSVSHNRNYKKDGTVIYCEWYNSALLDESGNLVSVLSLSLDVTERQIAQENLLERSRLAALSADINATLTQTHDLQTILQQCTAALVQHLDIEFAQLWTLSVADNMLELQAFAGVDTTHINGKNSRVPVGRLNIDTIAQPRQPYLTNSVLDNTEISAREWLLPEGIVAFARYPLIVEQHVVGVMAVEVRQPLSEITLKKLASIGDAIAQCIERKRIDTTLQESEERYRSLVEFCPETIAVHCNEKFIYINPAGAKLLGAANPEELIDKSIWDIIHPDSIETVRSRVRHNQELATITPIEEQKLVRLDGQAIDVEATGRPIAYRGKPAIQVVIRDITDRKRAQQALAHFIAELEIRVQERTAELQKAEEDIRQALVREKELSELKCRFITMASHEFRTPLAIILIASDLIKRFGDKLTPQKKLIQLNKIQNAVKHMTQLLENVLFINQAAAGRIAFNPVSLNIQTFCREFLSKIEFIDEGKHKLFFQCQGDCSLVEMDETLIRQMLTHLLNNAIKYSPQGCTVQLKLVCENGKVIFQIQDRGIGIPESDRSRIFEAFHRGSNVGNIGGIGIGMTAIQHAVELHGGSVTIESELGVGTTFIICLPRTPGQQESCTEQCP